MAILDVESLLEPVSEEDPCGPNLEYDEVFTAFEQAARGKVEQQYGDTIIPAEPPDWPEVLRLGQDLLSRTRDLRVACVLTRALLETEGFPGFAEGLALIRGYVERYWPTLHPLLDPEDDNDPTLRVNTISSLADPATTMRSLSTTPMVASRAFGRFSLRDLAIASGELPPLSEEEPPKHATIEAAFMQCELDQLKSDATAVRQSIEDASAIEAAITQQVGAANAVSLEGLRDTLGEVLATLGGYLSRRDVTVSDGLPAEDGEGGAEGSAVAARGRLTGEVQSREDVMAALDKICQYYERYEPSSPVPLLLRRAKRLTTKSFLEIVRDLTPDAVGQIESLGGVDQEESDD